MNEYDDSTNGETLEMKTRSCLSLLAIPILFFLLVSFALGGASFCNKRKKNPFERPPSLSIFDWNKSIQDARQKLKEAGCNIVLQNDEQLEISLPSISEDFPKTKEVTGSEPPASHITLYSQNGSLRIVRLYQQATLAEVKTYIQNLKKDYRLGKSVWDTTNSYGQSKEQKGNSVTVKINLYKGSNFFAVIYLTSIRANGTKSPERKNDTVETVLYSRLNPGITKKKLIQSIEQGDSLSSSPVFQR